MRCSFEIRHIPGASNLGPDALSRYPGVKGADVHMLEGARPADVLWSDELKQGVVAAVRSGPRIISWSMVQEAGISDPKYVGVW